jgi:arsenite-transporting ATPase
VRLLSLPEAARWWLDRIMPIQRRAVQLAGPMLRRLTGMPMPGDAVFRAGEDLFRKLDRMHRLLTDQEVASIRIVVNPEPMVIAEARRSFTYFHLFGYPTDLVVCNRVLPQESGDYFRPLRESQQRHLATLGEAFAPVPIRTAPYFPQEVIGTAALRALGTAIFEAEDPATFFHHGRPYRVEREDGHYTLSLDLPNVSDTEVDLIQEGDELVLHAGPWRRNLVLPRVLADLTAEDALLKDGVLRIRFGSPERSNEEVAPNAR